MNHGGHKSGSQWGGGWGVKGLLDALNAMQQTVFQLDASSWSYCGFWGRGCLGRGGGISCVTNHGGLKGGSQWEGGWVVYALLDALIAMQ
jgi:hypothetical protein